MVDPLEWCSGRKRSQVKKSSHSVSFQLRTWKFVVVAMLVNTDRSRVVTSMSPWTSRWNFTIWLRWKLHLQIQKIIWEYQERVLLSLWVSRPKQVQTNTKRQGMPSEMPVRRTVQRLLGSLKNYLMKFMRGRGPNMSLLTVNFTQHNSLWSIWWELMLSTCTFTL